MLLFVILGEVIDLDETRTGRRREAVFGGLHGVSVKAGQALSILVATQLMSLLGNSFEEPLGVFIIGPVGGLFATVGVVVMLYYPVLDVTKKTTEEFLSSTSEKPAAPQ